MNHLLSSEATLIELQSKHSSPLCAELPAQFWTNACSALLDIMPFPAPAGRLWTVTEVVLLRVHLCVQYL